jgi:hypothetical protein
MERLLELTKRHKEIMDSKNILVSIYTNASGFLWQLMKVDSGTGLGDNWDLSNCKTFKSNEDALEDALDLIDKCDLEKFQKECPKNEFHWGNYAIFVHKKYRSNNGK